MDDTLTLEDNPKYILDGTDHWCEFEITHNSSFLISGEILNKKSAAKFPTLSRTSLSLNVRKTYQLGVLKKSSTDSVKSYKSSKSSIAYVSKTGKITAKKAGTCYITVTMKSGRTAKCKVVVKPAKTTKIAFTHKTLTIRRNRLTTLKIKRSPYYAGDKLTWKSSKPKIVKVYQSGKVKGLTKGKSIITVKAASGKYARITITVK